ncbi:hypothetical protein [Methylobacterium sp. 1030]|uniref:hypothetical protein n=1 Tax=Methylobacterium sp. 1030 TaxID=3156404 RepID=UPI0033983364
MSDPFFEQISDGQWNACVGSQGAEENYVDGYIEAAIELALAVIDKKMYSSRDTLAMPILYNGRHALELALKYAISTLAKAGLVPEVNKLNHDIRALWQHLHDAQIGDEGLKNIIGEVNKYVVSLSSIDEDGQQLRYFRTQDGSKSLENISVVNLPLIRSSLIEMGDVLTRLKYRVADLIEEHSSGTYTKECSRLDLMKIAAIVGDKSTWKGESFDVRKQEARNRFGLSGRQLSRALDQIQKSRELGGSIGVEQQLAHLSDDKLVSLLTLWAEKNPVKTSSPDDLGSSYWERDFEQVFAGYKEQAELNRKIKEMISIDELADLTTLFHIGRGGEKGEHYDDVLAHFKRDLGSDKSNGVAYITSKTSLLENVILGTRAVGRPSLSAKLQAIRA